MGAPKRYPPPLQPRLRFHSMRSVHPCDVLSELAPPKKKNRHHTATAAVAAVAAATTTVAFSPLACAEPPFLLCAGGWLGQRSFSVDGNGEWPFHSHLHYRHH